jgi:hypothetical protein
VTPSAAGGLELSARDRQVLQATADLRLITGGQLMRLVFRAPAATSHNARIARRCLQRLTATGLLWRLERRVGGIRAGSSSYVYALSPAGGRALGEATSRGRSREPSLTFQDHTLTVSEIYVQLFEHHYLHPFEELVVETEPSCWRSLDDGSGGILKPDLLVTAITPDEERWLYIEVDRGTEHIAAIQRKVALYRAHQRSGREQARLGGFPAVLWLVPNQHRATQLRRYLEPANREQRGLHTVAIEGDVIKQLTERR